MLYNHQSVITYPHRHVAHFPGSTAPTKSDPGGPGSALSKPSQPRNSDISNTYP